MTFKILPKQRICQLLSGLLIAASQALTAAPMDNESMSHGEYVSILGDCVACHTVPGGKPFAGGSTLR